MKGRRQERVRWLGIGAGAALVALAAGADALLGGAPGFGRGQQLLAAAGAAAILASWLAPSAWIRQGLAVAASALVAIVLAEGVLWIALTDSLASVHGAHPERLHALVPGASKLFRHHPDNGGHTVEVRIHEAGLRGGAVRSHGAARRVLVLGDSFVEAEFSAEEETFVAQLGAALEADVGGPVEALNAGCVAYGPDQALLWLGELAPELKPDLVVVAIFAGNDFGDLVRNKLFRLVAEDPPTVARHRPEVAPEVAAQLRMGQSSWLLRKLVARLARRFDSAEPEAADGESIETARVERWLAERLDEHTARVEAGDAVVRNLFRDEHDADLTLAPDGRSARHKRALMEGVLARIVAVAGAPVVFVAVPSPVDLAGGEGYAHARVDRERHPGYRPTAPTDALAEMARRRGWTLVDLYAPFVAAGGAPALYWQAGDDHWNAAGQQLAGELVAAAVRDAGLMRR